MLGEVKAVGNYEDLVGQSIRVDLDGYSTYILSIPALIIAKRAAGRPKDQAGLQVLEALEEAQKADN